VPAMTTPPPYGQDPPPPAPEHNQAPPPPQDPYQQPPAYPQPPTYQPPPAYSPPPTYQVSGPPTYPTSGGGQPYSPYPPPYSGAPSGYGFDPATGQPYSDKSKLAAGLLQLLPGFFLGLGGIGRLYAGHITLGVVQLALTVLAYVSLCCSVVTLGLALVAAVPLAAAGWLWPVIDGIVMLAGNPTDGQGRPLRP
jgi:TM2 domain-containing membrane protein YozV